ncbi:MAG TPA: TerC family protein [Myxococcota bacterium]|nr:TerC family protein [Myxococcota bacterium]
MSALVWIGFLAVVLICLAFDLGVFHREARVVRSREAFVFTGIWVALACLFGVVVYYAYAGPHGSGPIALHDYQPYEAVQLYFTAYLVEYSLSLDNIVVIALIFTQFGVPLALQHRVLFWGVLGAIVMRFGFILAGSALLAEIDWIRYVFGALLLLAAARLLFGKDEGLAPEKNIWVRLARRVVPVHDHFDGSRFFTRHNMRLHATRLFIVLLLVEGSDLIFAVDSIPAALAITPDPFLVYTSNIFAVMGLRSLYFAIAPLIERFRYLKVSLVFLLGFVGAKIIIHDHVEIPSGTTLAVITGTIAIGAIASFLRPGGGAEGVVDEPGPPRVQRESERTSS